MPVFKPVYHFCSSVSKAGRKLNGALLISKKKFLEVASKKFTENLIGAVEICNLTMTLEEKAKSVAKYSRDTKRFNQLKSLMEEKCLEDYQALCQPLLHLASFALRLN